MVTSKEGVSKETPIDKLQHIEKPSSEFHEPESSQKGRHSVLPETASGEVPQTQISDTNAHTSQSNSEGGAQTYQQGSSFSLIPKQELETLQHKQNLDGEMHSTQSYHEGISLSVSTKKEMDDMQQGQNIDTGNCLLESRAPLIIPEKVSDSLEQKQGLNSGGSPQYDKENVTLTRRPEKALDKLQPRRNPDTGVHALQADAEASTPSRIVEKPLEDGYNWRKYGQKLVRGNEFIRSYYKCTYPNCPAKKQVERPHNGHLTDIHYLGRHEHPKPQHSPLPVFDMPISTRSPDGSSLSTAATESTSRHGETSQQIESTENLPLSTVSASNEVGMASQPKERRYEVDNNNCDSNPKRQKRDVPGSDDTLVNKLNSDSRLVIKTTSEVDIVSDGYRWRKYGQKLVKGNPNPRSYYRCSNGGCPVKKHVERASHDPRVVITTYEGQHDHDMPPARTATHNVAGSNATKPDEKEAVGLEMMVRISAN